MGGLRFKIDTELYDPEVDGGYFFGVNLVVRNRETAREIALVFGLGVLSVSVGVELVKGGV